MERSQYSGWYDRDMERRSDWYRQSLEEADAYGSGTQWGYLTAGAVLLGVGGYLLYLGARDSGAAPSMEGVRSTLGRARRRMEDLAQGRLGGDGIDVRERITVDRPVSDLYRFWRDVENLPRVMGYLERVTKTDDRHSHWVAKGPGGKRVEWDAEVTDAQDNQRISWRSLEGAEIPNEGTVRFSRAADGQGTVIDVSLTYYPPGGEAGATMAGMVGREPSQEVRRDLQRFKERVESGELTLGGASHGSSFSGI